jgi:Signal transduction histidine kinase
LSRAGATPAGVEGAESAVGVVSTPARLALGDLGSGDSRFAQVRVERILSLVTALGCTALGTQAFLNALGTTQESQGWHVALMVMAFLPLALMVIALASGRLVRATSAVCAVMLVIVFVCWPLAAGGGAAVAQPWTWYLLNVATAAAVMAVSLPAQIVWAFAAPVSYLVARLIQVDVTPAVAVDLVLDAVFAIILAGVIIAIAGMLRSVARGLDAARTEAVASYAAAAEADAVEAERVAVAALMHDSVLAALIAAERASTPREEALAVSMAREALTRLANAEQDAREGPEEPVTLDSVVAEIERAAAVLGSPVAVGVEAAVRADEIPGRVARAIVLATTQAIANAMEHAGGHGLAVAVTGGAARVAVRISDTGPGFAPAEVPPDRLGIRGSIVARLAAAGGRARVHTGASGTVVDLAWEQRS